MKKLLIVLVALFALLPVKAFAVDAVYRVSSGEVTYIGDDAPATYDGVYKMLVVGVTLQDGSAVRDSNGDYRILGYAKIYDGGTVRNATQNEINAFEAAEIDDNNQRQANKAIQYFQNDPQFRRIMMAYTDILIEYEINKYRKWFQDFAEQMALATSLANLQTRMAALAAANPMPNRELSQMRTQIINRISKDD